MKGISAVFLIAGLSLACSSAAGDRRTEFSVGTARGAGANTKADGSETNPGGVFGLPTKAINPPKPAPVTKSTIATSPMFRRRTAAWARLMSAETLDWAARRRARVRCRIWRRFSDRSRTVPS